MVSEHASPLATLGGVDAGGQNVHVAALSGALADRGHEVTVYTRREDPSAPVRVPLRAGVDADFHLAAGVDRRRQGRSRQAPRRGMRAVAHSPRPPAARTNKSPSARSRQASSNIDHQRATGTIPIVPNPPAASFNPASVRSHSSTAAPFSPRDLTEPSRFPNRIFNDS